MLSNIINDLIDDLEPRQREIVSGRFGLGDGEKETLASLGEKYGITRERVRQIEAEVLKEIKESAEKSKLGRETLEKISRHLNSLGGIRRDDIFLEELRFILDDENLHHYHLRFLAEISGKPEYCEEDENFHFFWHLGKDAVKKVKQFVNTIAKSISNKQNELISGQKFDVFFSRIAKTYKIPEIVALNYLLASRKFGVNPFGDFGLTDWEEINPKTIRSKAYLILKKQNQPMHFREVSAQINRINLGDRPALPQTVHNELIKDPRIFLVGRGIYGLQNRDFIPGTTRDVICKILKNEGPLPAKDLVELVKKQRVLKDNTIILNLQNRKYFKKLNDGRIAARR